AGILKGLCSDGARTHPNGFRRFFRRRTGRSRKSWIYARGGRDSPPSSATDPVPDTAHGPSAPLDRRGRGKAPPARFFEEDAAREILKSSCTPSCSPSPVILSEAKNLLRLMPRKQILRRCAPQNDRRRLSAGATRRICR